MIAKEIRSHSSRKRQRTNTGRRPKPTTKSLSFCILLLCHLATHCWSWKNTVAFVIPSPEYQEQRTKEDSATPRKTFFVEDRPLLAIITETDACDDDHKLQKTYNAIRSAVSTQQVDLVSVRLSLPQSQPETVLERACILTEKLLELSKEFSFRVVCSSDLLSVAVKAKAHGVHLKEHHLDKLLPSIRSMFDYEIVLGTSAHSLESALKSGESVDYYFVGTCFLTASHPEKTSESQLEGPSLPGEIKAALKERGCSHPRILAIGGIDASNCKTPVSLGADGVAVIRAVLQAHDPAESVSELQTNMQAK